jgi:hypothetical protein
LPLRRRGKQRREAVEVATPCAEGHRRAPPERDARKHPRVDHVDVGHKAHAVAARRAQDDVDHAPGGASPARGEVAGQHLDAVDEVGGEGGGEAVEVKRQADGLRLQGDEGVFGVAAAQHKGAEAEGRTAYTREVLHREQGVAAGAGHTLQVGGVEVAAPRFARGGAAAYGGLLHGRGGRIGAGDAGERRDESDPQRRGDTHGPGSYTLRGGCQTLGSLCRLVSQSDGIESTVNRSSVSTWQSDSRPLFVGEAK